MRLSKKKRIIVVILCFLVVCVGGFLYEIGPVQAEGAPSIVFQVSQGEGFRAVASSLQEAGIIRSSVAFDVLALVGGRAFRFKPGIYRLSPSMGSSAVIDMLTGPSAGTVTVTIPPGTNLFQVDSILSNALVIAPGALINFNADGNLEGKLFPDTYQFYTNENVQSVVKVMMANFEQKAGPLFQGSAQNEEKELIIASILEKEVPDQNDQEIVAGIIMKRISAGMPLDIDATICYAKALQNPTSTGACVLHSVDFSMKSPYNTYLYKGLPPGPIANPGLSAITAALHPATSSYWYYLSDPATGQTIFAKTLDEQNRNKVKYIESN